MYVGNVGSSSLIVELHLWKNALVLCVTLFVLMSSTLAFKSCMLLFKYLSRIILNRNERFIWDEHNTIDQQLQNFYFSKGCVTGVLCCQTVGGGLAY